MVQANRLKQVSDNKINFFILYVLIGYMANIGIINYTTKFICHKYFNNIFAYIKIITYLCSMKCKCGKNTKYNRPLCYMCFITQKNSADFALATWARLQKNNVARHLRNAWRKSFDKHKCRGCGEDPYCYCGDGTPYSY